MHATEVKVVLASVATALAAYQLVLAAIGYRKLRIIEATPAFTAHRASGDTIAFLLIVVAVMCLSYFELEDGQAERDAREERLEERLEQQEERREDRGD